jgi:glycosyltransferase involved in cell wall biosynthesis
MTVAIQWLTNHYTYYNDYLFSELVRSQKYSLSVHYKALVLESHPWANNIESNYQYRIFKEKPFGFDIPLVRKAFFSNDFFVIAGWDCLTYILVITLLNIRDKRFAVFTDTPKRPGKSLKQSLKTSWLKWVFKKGGNAHLLVTGNIGVSMAESNLQISRSNIINFPFATNNHFFKPQHSDIRNLHARKLYLSVGRIDFSHKGQDIALKAFRILKDRGFKDFRYRVAGLGEDLDKFKELVKELHLEEQVELLGWREVSDLPNLFNESFFTVHSSHEDPFPNSILESLSCGTPVISSDLAGSGLDRIIPGANGYLHKDSNVEELATLLEETYKMPMEEYKRMRDTARSMAMEWQVGYNLHVFEEMVLPDTRDKTKIIPKQKSQVIT